ncbi:hypothetical protein KAU45_10665 [bacterium]|nr:hypothetical protein [bacterium]
MKFLPLVFLLTLVLPVVVMSESTPQEPILGINPFDTSYDKVARAVDAQRWIIAASLLEEPTGFRHTEFGDEMITVFLSNYEAGRVVHLSYSFTAKGGSADTVAHLEEEYRRLCDGFEELLGPGLRSGTGPVFGCYWTGADTESYVQYPRGIIIPSRPTREG